MTPALTTAQALLAAGDKVEQKKERARQRATAWRKANPERFKQSLKLWRAKNLERSKALISEWYKANKERANANAARWYAENSDRSKQCVAKWNSQNKERIRTYKRERFHTLPDDSNERIKSRLSTRIRMAVGCASKRPLRTEALLGCSISELKAYLEKQFAPGMSWANRRAWHIDHIIPCRSFDLSSVEEQKRCFHFTNLQPIWAKDNLSKGDKIEIEGRMISARKVFNP